VCGDGILDDGEECDDGNTVGGDCCTPTCTIEPAGTVCRAAVGECDFAETCDGTGGICPADMLSTDVCRPAADECDIEEVCDGMSLECPEDETIPDCTVCGNGIVEGDEECDDGNNNNGDGCDESCFIESPVPAVSTLGIVILTLAMGLLFAGQLYRRRFRHESR
jgi:cysteine-rich repeat protein